jgi:hypothetical protein
MSDLTGSISTDEMKKREAGLTAACTHDYQPYACDQG